MAKLFREFKMNGLIQQFKTFLKYNYEKFNYLDFVLLILFI